MLIARHVTAFENTLSEEFVHQYNVLLPPGVHTGTSATRPRCRRPRRVYAAMNMNGRAALEAPGLSVQGRPKYMLWPL